MKVSFGMYWQVYGRQEMEIPDDTEDVEKYLRDHWEEVPLPTSDDYITGSDELDEESIVIEE